MTKTDLIAQVAANTEMSKNGTVIWVDTHGFKAVEGKLSVGAKLVTAVRVCVSVGRRYFFRYGLGNMIYTGNGRYYRYAVSYAVCTVWSFIHFYFQARSPRPLKLDKL